MIGKLRRYRMCKRFRVVSALAGGLKGCLAKKV